VGVHSNLFCVCRANASFLQSHDFLCCER